MSDNAGVEEIKERNKQMISEVLTAYPEKTAKKRAKHLGTFEEGKSDCGVKSNLKTIPGVMTIRAVSYTHLQRRAAFLIKSETTWAPQRSLLKTSSIAVQ